ncbi:hypothetical protein F4680DRAFT_393480 [Xylaria scruposa]|nr:hypothetical protein F4680DRAFT_393480 [Xylaria scruposa]
MATSSLRDPGRLNIMSHGFSKSPVSGVDTAETGTGVHEVDSRISLLQKEFIETDLLSLTLQSLPHYIEKYNNNLQLASLAHTLGETVRQLPYADRRELQVLLNLSSNSVVEASSSRVNLSSPRSAKLQRKYNAVTTSTGSTFYTDSAISVLTTYRLLHTRDRSSSAAVFPWVKLVSQID